MSISKSIRPPNSLVLVEDSQGGDLPHELPGLVGATSSALAIGTYPEVDGDTIFAVAPKGDECVDGLLLAYEGVIALPSRRLVVRSVLQDELLGLDLEMDRVYLEVWASDLDCPESIVVLWAEVGVQPN
jgi:hypothetical protein